MPDRPAPAAAPLAGESDMRASYWRVIASWLLALAALYAFQEYFS